MKTLLAFHLLAVASVVTHAQWSQQGNKLVGIGAVGHANQGFSISISSDGNTAIVGGLTDSNSAGGAAWVYTRSGGVWSQQGNKLVGTGAVGNSNQGWAVSISSDGNTAILGGWGDNGSAGAAWVFRRSGGMWSQQGNKLVGTGAVGNSNQGYSVSLSSDGNTAIVGGQGDNGSAGAAWVFTRSGGVWSQQGNKLVGTGAVGPYVYQGRSVSLSSDGNTAIVGGSGDSSGAGAAWVFTRAGGVWSQQGNKLVGTGAVGRGFLGYSASLSSDGNTAIVGGPSDSSNAGAAWVFTRSSTSVGIADVEVSQQFGLEQNYPNPFNPTTTIRFQIPRQTDGGQATTNLVTLKVFNILGREVRTLVNETRIAGEHEVTFDARGLASGIYFYRLTAGSFVQTRKLVLLR